MALRWVVFSNAVDTSASGSPPAGASVGLENATSGPPLGGVPGVTPGQSAPAGSRRETSRGIARRATRAGQLAVVVVSRAAFAAVGKLPDPWTLLVVGHYTYACSDHCIR